MKDIYTVGLGLVQPLLHYKTTMPLAVSFPSAQTPEWDTCRTPPEPWTWSKTVHTCPVHSAGLHLTCMPQYEKPLAIFCDLETWECLLRSGCWLLAPTWRQATHVVEGNGEVYDLCSRTTVNLCSLLIVSAFGEKENHYTVTWEILCFTSEGIPLYFYRLEYPCLSTTFVYKCKLNIIMCCELVYHNQVSARPSLPWLFLRGPGGVSVPHRVLVSPCFIKSDRQPSKHTDVYILFPLFDVKDSRNYFSTVTYTPFHCTSIFHLKS